MSVAISKIITGETWYQSSPKTWEDYEFITWEESAIYTHYLDVYTGALIGYSILGSGEFFRSWPAERLGFDENVIPDTMLLDIPVQSFVLDSVRKPFDIGKLLKDKVFISENFGKVLTAFVTFPEGVDLDELAKSGYNHFRTFAYNLDLAELRKFNISIINKESLQLFSDYIRSINGVISAIYINTEPYEDQHDFMEKVLKNHIPYFTRFNSFIQGNYTYENAYFRTTLVPNVDGAQIRLSKLKVTSDVPDIHNSGTDEITIANSGVTIFFDIPFTLAESIRINAIHTGGEVLGVPEITNITTSSFLVKLKTSSTAYTRGFVNWAAHGY